MPTTFVFIFILISSIGFGIIATALKYFLHIDVSIAIMLTPFFQGAFIVWAMNKLDLSHQLGSAKITEYSRQRILLHMLIGGALLLCGLTLTIWATPQDLRLFLPASGLGFIGTAWLVWASARFFLFTQAARENPALLDERVTSDIRKSQTWGFFACLNTAVILGFIDFNGWLPLSGATVGFSAAIVGLLTLLASQYWLERKNG